MQQADEDDVADEVKGGTDMDKTEGVKDVGKMKGVEEMWAALGDVN
jgi:hypothetical protein